MLYPVRILDARGKLRKLVSRQELSQLHWKNFERMISGEFNMMNSRKRPGQGDGLNDGPDYEEETLESDT